MKHLPKHLRPGRRYLAVGLESRVGASIERRDFQRAVWIAAQSLLGDPGSAAAGLDVIRFRFENGRGEALVRVRRGEVEPARAALACVADVDGEPLGVHVRGVSGTIRGAREKFLEFV